MTQFIDLDMRHSPALLVGQGPSSWGVAEPPVFGWLTDLRDQGLIVVTCNRGWTRCGCDYVFAMDPGMIGELFDSGVHRHTRIVCSDRGIQSRMMAGEDVPDDLEDGVNFFTHGWMTSGGLSTGVAAFQALVYARCPSITLIGFDGSRDQRNAFTGTPGYRSKVTHEATMRGWEQNMVKIVHHARTSMSIEPELALAFDGDHPLHEVMGRLSVAELPEHLATEILATCPR